MKNPGIQVQHYACVVHMLICEIEKGYWDSHLVAFIIAYLAL